MNIYFLLILSLLSTGSAFSQKSFTQNNKLNGVLPLDESGNVVYQLVKPAQDVSKAELYKRARKWFIKSFASPKESLQVDDAGTGEISAIGNFQVKPNPMRAFTATTIFFRIMVEAKDNKYRLTVSNFTVSNLSQSLMTYKLPYIATTEKHYTELYSSIDTKTVALIASLEKALDTPTDF